MLDVLISYRDSFFYLPFGTDVVLCAVQWPLFAWTGSAGMLSMLAGERAKSSPGYRKLYDLFML
eukprot:gene44184-60082_t